MIEPIGFDETDEEYTARLEAEVARLEEIVRPAAGLPRDNLRAIIVRCDEGDPRSDWLPIISRLAKEALAALPATAAAPAPLATAREALEAANELADYFAKSFWGTTTLATVDRAVAVLRNVAPQPQLADAGMREGESFDRSDEPWQNIDAILDVLDKAGCCTGTGYIHAAEDVVANALRDWLRSTAKPDAARLAPTGIAREIPMPNGFTLIDDGRICRDDDPDCRHPLCDCARYVNEQRAAVTRADGGGKA